MTVKQFNHEPDVFREAVFFITKTLQLEVAKEKLGQRLFEGREIIRALGLKRRRKKHV